MKSESTEIFETPNSTLDLKNELVHQLADMLPDVFADGKFDLEKLREYLSDDFLDDRERFGLFWPGKKRALRAAQESTSATLKPNFVSSINWETSKNIFIEGDNLEALKILQKHYHGKVKMIYIDPPYNTGNDFIYPDNYKEGLSSYLEWTKQINEEGKKLSSNSESEGRYHSNWLNMMFPRLKLARNLLREDGVIFISIGDAELANLSIMMREIFGEKNELPIFTRVTKKSSNNGATFSPCTDYIVGFARNLEILSPFSVDLTPDQIKSFNKSDEKGAYKEIGLFQAALKHGGSRYPIECPDGQLVNTPRGLPWRWNQAKLQDGLARNLIVFKQTPQSPLIDDMTGARARWNVYTKLYLQDREEDGLLPKNFSDEFQNSLGTRDLSELGIPFDFPKPVKLVKFLLGIINDPDALVLDLFAGSGTTAQAVLEQNAADGGTRKFILTQLPEPTQESSDAFTAGYRTISEVTLERIRKAGEKVQDSLGGSVLDIGFRAYELVDSHFPKWNTSSDIQPEELRQQVLQLGQASNSDSKSEELVTEILLKQGYSLSEDIRTFKVGELALKSISEGVLLAYLELTPKPTLNQFREILEMDPAKFIILEDVFAGDDELKTNLVQECKSRKIELWTA